MNQTNSPPCVGLWKDRLLLDGSAVTSFLLCRRRWYIEHVLRRIPATEPQSLRFGRALHLALYKQAKGQELSQEDLTSLALDFEDDHRNAGLLQVALEQYKLLDLDLKPLTRDGEPMVEVPFAIPLTETIIYCGRIDRIVRLPNGAVAVEDFKTASYDSNTFWRDFEVSVSQIGYCWAVSQLFKEPVTTNIITAFFTRKVNPSWTRKIFFHPESQIEEWRALVLDVAERMLRFMQATPEAALTAPANPVACFGFKFGQCHFYPACEMPDGASRLNVLHSLGFKQNQWSPLKPDETHL